MNLPDPPLPDRFDDSMPFYGNAFFSAVEGRSAHVAIGYLRAIWKYWNHTHCAGLPDDDEYLRAICHCPEKEWGQTKAVIFDNDQFFCLNGDGKWHQKRASQAHATRADLYRRQVARAEYARSKLSSNISPNLSANSGLSSAREITLRDALDRALEELKTLRNSYDSHQAWSAKDLDRRKTLVARKKELQQLLGVVV